MSTNRSEVLNIANHLNFADNLFNRYKTFYNEQQDSGKENYLLMYKDKLKQFTSITVIRLFMLFKWATFEIMNEVDIKYTILVSIEILPHQSAYLNIIFFTLKSNRVFPKIYIYKIKYTMISLSYSSKMCMVSFFSCFMRYHKRLNIYR